MLILILKKEKKEIIYSFEVVWADYKQAMLGK